jgi:hypothetical protein
VPVRLTGSGISFPPAYTARRGHAPHSSSPGPSPRRGVYYDGWSMLAVKEAGRVRLVSRNERYHTRRFREIVQALTKLRPETSR